MREILELADKDFKIVITNVFRNLEKRHNE